MSKTELGYCKYCLRPETGCCEAIDFLRPQLAAAKAETHLMREWWALAIERGKLLQKYSEENKRLREALEKIVKDCHCQRDEISDCYCDNCDHKEIARATLDGGKA